MFGYTRISQQVWFVVLSVGLAACGDDPPLTPTPPSTPSTVTTVTVTPDGATLVSLGQNIQLAAAAFDADGDEMDGQAFNWTSSDEMIATTDASGLVSAIADGQVQIEASTGGVVGSASVTVRQEIASIVLLEQPNHSELLQPITARAAYLDALGSAVGAATEPIEVALSANPASGTLSGTTSVVPRDGLAEFADLRLDRAGSGYTLLFSSPSADGVESDPFDVSLKFGSLSTGTGHTCAISAGSEAYCWGSNGGNRLGHDLDPLRPGAVARGINFTRVESGFDHNCALGADDDALCWGSNGLGQLGRRDQSSFGGVPDFVDGGPYDAIDAGRFFTCGVTRARVECWGSNAQGQLGDGTTTDSPVPVAVTSTEEFAAVSTGYAHACALTTDGVAWCWGDNSGGQLGDGTANPSNTPVAPLTNETFRVVSAGVSGTCGVTFDDNLICWGIPLGGQPSTPTPPTLVSSPPLFDVSMGLDGHACAIATSFQAYCWGENGAGQLGNDSQTDSTTPVLVHGGMEFENISAGDGHTCAVTDDREVYCWGGNTTGQLGNGTTTFSSVPVRVTP